MASELLRSVVILKRPVIVKEGYTRQGENGKPNVFIPAQVKMEDTPAIVIGVEPQIDPSTSPHPKLSLAFAHPDRLHSLSGSGWRDTFDRLQSVLHQSDELALDEPLIARWRELDEVDLSGPVPKFREEQKKEEAAASTKEKPKPIAVVPKGKVAAEKAAAEEKARAEKESAEKKAYDDKVAAEAKKAEEVKA